MNTEQLSPDFIAFISRQSLLPKYLGVSNVFMPAALIDAQYRFSLDRYLGILDIKKKATGHPTLVHTEAPLFNKHPMAQRPYTGTPLVFEGVTRLSRKQTENFIPAWLTKLEGSMRIYAANMLPLDRLAQNVYVEYMLSLDPDERALKRKRGEGLVKTLLEAYNTHDGVSFQNSTADRTIVTLERNHKLGASDPKYAYYIYQSTRVYCKALMARTQVRDDPFIELIDLKQENMSTQVWAKMQPYMDNAEWMALQHMPTLNNFHIRSARNKCALYRVVESRNAPAERSEGQHYE